MKLTRSGDAAAGEYVVKLPDDWGLPLTHPSVLKELKKVEPESAKQVIAQVLEDARHQRRMDFCSLLGAFAIAAGTLALAAVLAIHDRELGAGAIVAGVFGVLGMSGMLRRLFAR